MPFIFLISCYILLQVKKTVFSAGYLADVDLDHGTTLNKKIRNAQLAQYNFIFGRFYFFVSQMLLPRVTWLATIERQDW